MKELSSDTYEKNSQNTLNRYFADDSIERNFEQDIFLVILSIIITLIGAFNSIENTQNLRFISHKNSIIFTLSLLSLIYSSMCIWTPYFIFLFAMKFKDVIVYIDIRLVLFGIISSIFLNICGFCIAYLPFFDRTYVEFKNLIEYKISNNEPNSHLSNLNRLKTLTFKKKNSKLQNKESSNFNYKKKNNNSISNEVSNCINDLNNENCDKQEKNITNKNINNSDKISNINKKSENNEYFHSSKSLKHVIVFDKTNKDEKIQNMNINSSRIGKQEEQNICKSFRNEIGNRNSMFENEHSLKEYDFSNFFLKKDIYKKDFIYCLLGGVFIGLSYTIIHFLSVSSINICNKNVSFNIPMETGLGILAIIGSYFIIFSFYNKYSFLIKIAFSFGISLFSTTINFVSLRFSHYDISKNDNDITTDLIININVTSKEYLNFNNSITNNSFYYLNDSLIEGSIDFKGLVSVEDFVKVVIIFVIVLPIISMEILNSQLIKSNKIIQYIKNYAARGKKELNFILNYYEFLKDSDLSEEYEKSELNQIIDNDIDVDVFFEKRDINNEISSIINENYEEEYENIDINDKAEIEMNNLNDEENKDINIKTINNNNNINHSISSSRKNNKINTVNNMKLNYIIGDNSQNFKNEARQIVTKGKYSSKFNNINIKNNNEE